MLENIKPNSVVLRSNGQVVLVRQLMENDYLIGIAEDDHKYHTFKASEVLSVSHLASEQEQEQYRVATTQENNYYSFSHWACGVNRDWLKENNIE